MKMTQIRWKDAYDFEARSFYNHILPLGIPLIRETTQALLIYMARYPEIKPDDFVLTSPRGGRVHPSTVYQCIHNAIGQLTDLRCVRLKELRVWTRQMLIGEFPAPRTSPQPIRGDFTMRSSQSREDYLKTIFLLGHDGRPVRNADIARAMNFTPVSVGNAIKRLAAKSEIWLDAQKHIHLTDTGYSIAVRIYEKHVFFRKLLEFFGIEREIAENEASRVGHTCSDKTFELVREKLMSQPCGRLGFCPCFIPSFHAKPHEDGGAMKCKKRPV
jgi:Mn-dependent DtxR family transcriptional regulator